MQQDPEGEFTAGPSFQVPLPLFNQGQPAVAAAVARFRRSRRRFTAMAAEARAQVRRARNAETAARDLAEYYGRVIVPLRHQIVEQTQLHLNAMQVGVFELLQSKQAEIDAGREYVEALRDYWVARAELERATGGRLEPTLPATRPAPSPANPDSTTRPGDQVDQADQGGPGGRGHAHTHHHGE